MISVQMSYMILAAWASGPSKIGHNHATIQLLSPKSSHHHIPHHTFDDMMGWCTIRWFRTYVYHEIRCDIQQYHDLPSCNQAWQYIENHILKNKNSIYFAPWTSMIFPMFHRKTCGIFPSAVRARNGNQLSKDDVLRDGAHVVGLFFAHRFQAVVVGLKPQQFR